MSPGMIVVAAVFEGFVNPGLLGGVALCSVPILIHLFNRQRHKPLRWAAMRFVLAAYRKTRRRVQLENLLLLLLRAAAVAALALAVARPFSGAESPLAGLSESRRDVMLVLDGSASTGYGLETETVHERIVDRAREIVLALDDGRGDRARVVHAGAWPRLLAWSEPRKALAVLDALSEPTCERLDLAGALGEVLRFAEEEAAGTGWSGVEVRLLTDLQRSVFAQEAGADGNGPELRETLDRLAQLGLRVLVEDLGPPEALPPNLGLTAVAAAGPIVGPGAPVDVRVGVANHGPLPRSGLRVALEVDGERRPSQPVDVPARGVVEATFPVVFRAAGDHVVTAELEGDRLPIDDRRAAILRVPAPVRALVVNGARAAEIERDAAGFLMAVLEPPRADDLSGASAPAPFAPREVDPRELDGEELDLSDYDLILTVDVDVLSPGAVERIRERVAAGGALLITMGPHVEPESWNQRLFKADGSGLLPAELSGVVSVAARRESYYTVREFELDHPVLRFFADVRWKPFLTEVPIYDFMSVRPLEQARVLARLDDGAGSPLLVERDFVRGRVALWTTSLDPSWTQLPILAPQAFVPLVHELVRYLGASSAPPLNLAPGSGVTSELSRFPRRAELVRPDGTRRAIEGEIVEVGRDRWRLPAIDGADTERTGAYRIETEGAGEVLFAVQLEPAEGDLERIAPGELAELHPALKPWSPADEGGDEDDGLPRRGELWRWLAGACLLALVAETLWAAWIGHRRRRL